jgi:hypothetical protein
MKVNWPVGCCVLLFFVAAGCAHPVATAPTHLKYRERSAPRPSGACQALPMPFTEVVAEKIATYPKDTVHGRVLLPNGDHASGLVVNVGQRRALTDADGRFVLDEVPATYDVVIADPDRRRVTAYHLSGARARNLRVPGQRRTHRPG